MNTGLSLAIQYPKLENHSFRVNYCRRRPHFDCNQIRLERTSDNVDEGKRINLPTSRNN
jgi:hypothetical protein